MRVLEEIYIFLSLHPTEIIFISCVADEGILGETFCKISEISISEIFFCISKFLGNFLGPPIHQGITIQQLIQRLFFIIYIYILY